MNKKNLLLILIFAILAIISGIIIYKIIQPSKKADITANREPEPTTGVIPTLDPSVKVDLTRSKKDRNSILLAVAGLKNKMSLLEYEVSYDSEGLIKGVNSGSKPIELKNQDTFDREIYLGTCSRNVCKPDVGVTKVSISLKFTDTNNKISQYTKDFDI